MTEKTLTLYFADDGTPFKENKDACKIYVTEVFGCLNLELSIVLINDFTEDSTTSSEL